MGLVTVQRRVKFYSEIIFIGSGPEVLQRLVNADLNTEDIHVALVEEVVVHVHRVDGS